MDIRNNVIDYILASERLFSFGRAALILLAGYIIAQMASRWAARLAAGNLSVQGVMLSRRIVYYLLMIIFLISALNQMGFELKALLGAAGIFSVAIGFAAKTSMSNLISGLFLIGERPFVVGDLIRVGTTTGEVISIDLLSAKLRTLDNLFVRIPNETLVGTEVTTLTRFPIRRLDLQVGVAYKENIPAVREILFGVAAANNLCLEEPKPLFIFQGFGESSLDIQFSVWAKRDNFLDLRNTIHEQIKDAFDSNNIEIPFPHRTLYVGEQTKPMPVTMV
ncbi:mechanosensitive ion channel family protein [Methanococcoides sp. SA1]|nr:mechanosensitive ion channel family protein [Methanococcoides sp. SA1]